MDYNSLEQTLILIKPDALDHTYDIIRIFEQNGLVITKIHIGMQLDKEIIKEHYQHLLDKPFFNEIEEYMMSKPVNAMVVAGNNSVALVRELVGPTDPKEAKEGTIRKLYGTDKSKNAIHASDSVENAKIEIERFFGNERTRIRK